MTRLDAIRHIRQGEILNLEHVGVESVFRTHVTHHPYIGNKVRCIFINVRPWGGRFGVDITPLQLLSYIKRNFVR